MRRMVCKTVIDTDMFLDMPLSTQCLYFHLLLEGDDDGFVASPKRIVRKIGASEDDMRALIDKGYAMAFESGVIAIRHWRVHNQIRRDRYTSTACVEMSLLVKDKKNVYQFQPSGAEPSGSQMETDRQPSVSQTETERQPPGNQAATQDRTGQDRIGKVRLGEDREDDGRAGRLPSSLPDRILALYHETCPSLPPVKVLTPQRKRALEELHAALGGSMDAVRDYFRKCANTPFLCGKGKNGWRANLDFLLDPGKRASIIDGKYDDWGDKDGADHGHSGETEGKASSLGADYEAFERQQKLPGDV